MTNPTPPTTEKKKEKKKTMTKTARPKNVMIDDKAYVKCPHPECDYMVEDWGYDPKTGLGNKTLVQPWNKVHEHVREVHKLVWLRKGKTAGWWSLSKFHPRPKSEEMKERGA